MTHRHDGLCLRPADTLHCLRLNDQVGTLLYLALNAGSIGAVHWRVWRRTLPAFAAGVRGRPGTLLAVAGWQWLGAVIPAGLLFGFIGVEEVAGIPLVPERIALVTLALTALQLLAGLAMFAVAVWRTRKSS